MVRSGDGDRLVLLRLLRQQDCGFGEFRRNDAGAEVGESLSGKRRPQSCRCDDHGEENSCTHLHLRTVFA